MFLEMTKVKDEYLVFSRKIHPTILKVKIQLEDKKRIKVVFSKKTLLEEDSSTLRFELMLETLNELWKIYPQIDKIEAEFFEKEIIIHKSKKENKSFLEEQILEALIEYVTKNPESLVATNLKKTIIKALYKGDIS